MSFPLAATTNFEIKMDGGGGRDVTYNVIRADAYIITTTSRRHSVCTAVSAPLLILW